MPNSSAVMRRHNLDIIYETEHLGSVEGRSLADVTLPALLNQGGPPRERNRLPHLGHGDGCRRNNRRDAPSGKPRQQGAERRTFYPPAYGLASGPGHVEVAAC